MWGRIQMTRYPYDSAVRLWADRRRSMWEIRNAYRILVGKSERMKPLGRPILSREYNIKVHF
jgi:hypothetical protein